jgi:Cu2+-exporting ATPase
VLVGVGGKLAAMAGFGDPIRRDAAGALARIRARGWRVGMLSGDHPDVAAAVGRRLGLDAADVRGGMLPEAKLAAVEDSLARGPVVMVGDGVNDAAALSLATVGIGVHGGAEAALAAADVFLTLPGLSAVAEVFEGSHHTIRVIRRNLVFSLCYNVIGATLAIVGVINPLLAAVLMPASSITVIVSSYRARMFGG